MSVWGCILGIYAIAVHDYSVPFLHGLVANSSASLIGIFSSSIIFVGTQKYARTLVSEVSTVADKPGVVSLRVHNLLGLKSSDVQQFPLKDFKFANENEKLVLYHVHSLDKDKQGLQFFFRKNGEIENVLAEGVISRDKPVAPPKRLPPKRNEVRLHFQKHAHPQKAK